MPNSICICSRKDYSYKRFYTLKDKVFIILYIIYTKKLSTIISFIYYNQDYIDRDLFWDFISNRGLKWKGLEISKAFEIISKFSINPSNRALDYTI